jgi:S-adenosylmethionine hydrolase
MSLITLTSDIGHQDYLVSAIKGQLLQVDPTFNIIDVSHGISPFNYPQAAYICRSAFKNFPPHTFHIVLVNLFDKKPERLLLAFHNDQYILCADNGLITMIVEGKPEMVIGLSLDSSGLVPAIGSGQGANTRGLHGASEIGGKGSNAGTANSPDAVGEPGSTAGGSSGSNAGGGYSPNAGDSPGLKAVGGSAPNGTGPRPINPIAEVAPKFYGGPKNTLYCARIMAEAINRIQNGTSITEIGEEDIEIEVKNPLRPRMTDNFIEGQIIFIDHFENIIVNITKDEFEEKRRGRDFMIVFRHGDKIEKISDHYSNVPEGEKLALFNSAGYLELAINKGNAAGLLGLSGFTEKSQNAQNRLIYQLVKVDFF